MSLFEISLKFEIPCHLKHEVCFLGQAHRTCLPIYHLGVAGVRQLATPIACAMRKGVNMHPSLQRTLAQTAKEKEVIETVAEHLVIHTIALSALVYYITSNDQEIKRKQKELDELKQEVQQLHQKFLLLR